MSFLVEVSGSLGECSCNLFTHLDEGVAATCAPLQVGKPGGVFIVLFAGIQKTGHLNVVHTILVIDFVAEGFNLLKVTYLAFDGFEGVFTRGTGVQVIGDVATQAFGKPF